MATEVKENPKFDKLAGELLTLGEMRFLHLQMESWSQIVYDRLVRTGA